MLHKRFNFSKEKACERGASLVEFAIVFPVLITILLTTIELGIMLAIKVNLQSCVQMGAFYGEAGRYTSGSSPTAAATAIMTSGASGMLNPSNLTITIQSFPTFSAASGGGGGSAGTGSEGQVGMYKMTYAYSPSSPLVAAFFGATKSLTATTYVRNEETFVQ
jgi:Flp pilus assembly protein TadG